MRVYLPATFGMLASLEENKLIHARNGWAFAATDALHDFFTSGDEEEIEAVAFDDAALTDDELAAGPAVWSQFHDPFPARPTADRAD